MKVSAKGRVTIPKAVRTKLGLEPGTEVEFLTDGDSAWIAPAGAARACGRRIVEHPCRTRTARMTTGQIMKLLGGTDDQ